MNTAALSLRRAVAAAEAGRHQLVVDLCSNALSTETNLRHGWELLSWALLELRRSDEALETVTQGLNVFPASGQLHYTASVVLHRLNELDRARTHIETAVSLSPTSPRFLARYARIACDQGCTTTAHDAITRSRALAPEDSFIMGEAVRVLCDLDHISSALEVAGQRLRQHPDDLWALTSHVYVLARAQQHGEVIRHASQVIRRAPNLYWIWALYAEALHALGSEDHARTAAREAIRLNPTTMLGGPVVAQMRLALSSQLP